MFADEISKIVNSNRSLIFPDHPTEKDSRIITEEVYDIMKTCGTLNGENLLKQI